MFNYILLYDNIRRGELVTKKVANLFIFLIFCNKNNTRKM